MTSALETGPSASGPAARVPRPRAATVLQQLEEVQRRMARRLHPDWHHGFPGAGSRQALGEVRRLNHAFEVLTELAPLLALEGSVTDPDRVAGAQRFRAPGPDECMFCGALPVAPASFRYHRGFLRRSSLSIAGPMCGQCGLAVGSAVAAVVRQRGWWGWRPAIGNLTASMNNAASRRALRSLDAPVPAAEGVIALLGRPLGRVTVSGSSRRRPDDDGEGPRHSD